MDAITPHKFNLLVLLALIRQESCFDASIVNHKSGATGLMQLMPATFNEWSRIFRLMPDIKNPIHNIIAGCLELERCISKFKDLRLALTAYNWGQGNLQRFIEQAKTHNWEVLKNFKGVKFNKKTQEQEEWTMPREAAEYADKIFKHYNDPELFELIEYWRDK